MTVVVGLAAILLVMVITSASEQKIVARDKVRVADIQTIRLALEEYKLACGVYPATLETTADNGNCPTGVTLGDFLPQIPVVPKYSKTQNFPEQGQDYFYYGLSTTNNGKCYDYIVGVQLEFGADNDFDDNESSEYFNQVDQVSLAPSLPSQEYPYAYRCSGSLGNGITDADDSSYGIYGFRSTTNKTY